MKTLLGLFLTCVATVAAAAHQSGCAPTSSDGDGETPAPAADGGAPGADDGGSSDGGGPVNGAASSCSTGTLYAGNPVYDGEPTDRPAPGTGILEDPPLQWQNLVFAGTNLYTRDQGEIWHVGTSAAAPVENRIAGLNVGATFPYKAGACEEARFAKIEGLAALPDGSLVVADLIGNGVLHVTDPTGPGCTVEYWAGNRTPSDDINPQQIPNVGDVDGPGADAKFEGPSALTVDGAGNVYVFDVGNQKVKKIANDAAHTVTTLAPLTPDGPSRLTNLAVIGGELYGVGNGNNKAFVLGIDTTSGKIRTVIGGGADEFPPIQPPQAPALAGLTTDGQGLIVSGMGYVWYLTTTGALKHIAGTGMHIDFPEDDYDPKSPHPAMELQLPPSGNGSLVGSADYITYHAGAVYYRGRHQGTASYVERIACP